MRGFERDLSRQLGILGIQGCRVAVAVSGGADSVALLRGLLAVRAELSLELTVGHVDHGLRGGSADDAAWVAAQCAEPGVAIETRCANIEALTTSTGGGIEETARQARYALLTQIAVESSSPFLAVGHTADDQAETILHHLLRGTGLGGLRGIPAERDLGSGVRLIRPLLESRREEARLYLEEIGQDFREDLSNADPAFTRNRIRRSLLPLLREEFNPRVEEALLRVGVQAGEWQELIGELADELLESLILDAQPEHVRLDCGESGSWRRPLLREALKRLWERQGWPLGGMSFSHWEQLAGLMLAADGAVQFPAGIDARRRGALLVISRPPANLH